jgi:hypothetical protein
MPKGKPAGVPCVQLDDDLSCKIFLDPARPAVCAGLQPHIEMCGDSQHYAIHWLTDLENQTRPPQS